MSIFLSSNVITFLSIEFILFLFAMYSFIISINIIRKWDFNLTTPYQYSLEKKSFLISTIIYFTIILKIFLFLFFASTLDSLASIVPGAMCAAGIINANSFGNILLFLKIIIIFIFAIWIIINKLDLKSLTYIYTKKKNFIYIFIFTLLIIEIVLDYLYFSNISTKQPVLCCSVVFGATNANNILPFNLSMNMMLGIFYIIYTLILISNYTKNYAISFISSLVFLFVAYYSVTYFFGTYIYELPSHKCPFCMLQQDYNYIGYIIWISLFLGVFFSMSSLILKLITKKDFEFTYKYAIVFSSIFVLLCSSYVLMYYFKNGVFL
jgi:hypothetical protein